MNANLTANARRSLVAAGIVSCLWLGSVPRIAFGADASDTSLQEIVVTAERRPEREQDVPISLSVLTGDELAIRGIENVRDLQFSIPNFTSYSQNNFHPNFLVRGFDSDASNIGFESGLGIYVDGVYMGRSEALTQELADVAQLEVLRGPQGTLFGKNTTLGAISVTTIRPTDTFQGSVSAEIGNFDEYRTLGYVAGPLVPSMLDGKVSWFYSDHSGYVNNVGGDPANLSDDHSYGVRGELRLTPAEQLDIALRADWSQTRSHPVDLQITDTPAGGNPLGIPLNNLESSPRTVNIDAPNRDDREIGGLSLTGNYVLDGYTLTSISAARILSYRVVGQDADATPYDYLTIDYYDRERHLTQEFRLASPDKQRLRYVVGAFYFYQKADSNRAFDLGPALVADAENIFGAPPFLLAPPVIETISEVATHSAAGYANGSFDLTENLSLLAGVRYTDETKTLTASQSVVPLLGLPGVLGPNPIYVNLPSSNDSLSNRDWSPTAGLSFRPTDAVTAYLRYSKGFKSGGWNDTLFSPTIGINPANPNGAFNYSDLQLSRVSFKPESITNYELGAKTEWFEHRLRANVAIFQEDYRDIQVSDFVGGNIGYITQNAALARSRGLELDAAALPLDHLEIDAAAGLAEARYLQYENGCGAGCNLNGYRLNAPEFTLTLSAQYTHQLAGDLQWLARADYSYRGDAPGSVINPQATAPASVYPYRLGGFGTVDGRIGVESQSGWRVYLWAKNLLDKNYVVQREAYTNLALLAVTQEGLLYGAPRTFGIRADYSFR
jgi:iron complex outermembrane receptor protein